MRCTIETFLGDGDDHIWIYIRNFNSLLDYDSSGGNWDVQKNIIFFLTHDNAKSNPAGAGNSYIAEIYIWSCENAKNYEYSSTPTTLIGHPQYYTKVEITAPALTREYGSLEESTFTYD